MQRLHVVGTIGLTIGFFQVRSLKLFLAPFLFSYWKIKFSSNLALWPDNIDAALLHDEVPSELGHVQVLLPGNGLAEQQQSRTLVEYAQTSRRLFY